MSIGGTSGNPATSSNILGLNLNGINLKYDLGPSMSTVASTGYNYLKSSFNADTALLGGTIMGAQQFVGGITSPIIQMAQTQQKFNVTTLPNMLDQLNTQNFQIGQQAVAAENNAANASIHSSQVASQQGGCYITSAVCDTLGLPDDCNTLRTLRHFRDTFMRSSNVRRAFVAEYYATAPRVVASIKARADGREILAGLYERFILPALLAIEHRTPERAFKIYRQMVYYARSFA